MTFYFNIKKNITPKRRTKPYPVTRNKRKARGVKLKARECDVIKERKTDARRQYRIHLHADRCAGAPQ